jgi:hypothetical protein
MCQMILTSKTVREEIETPENLISCPGGMYVLFDRICAKKQLFLMRCSRKRSRSLCRHFLLQSDYCFSYEDQTSHRELVFFTVPERH